MRRDLLGLGLDLVERLDDRRHADRAGARAVGAHAELHLVGVAVHDARRSRSGCRAARTRAARRWSRGPGRGCGEPVRTSTEPVGLTRTSADSHKPDAGAERADRLRRRDAAGFDVGRDSRCRAACRARALRACACRSPCSRRSPAPSSSEALIVAGVIGHDHRRLVRERLDEVLLAQIGRIDAQLARADLDQPLDHEGRLRAAGAAIGVDRHGVGVDRVDLAIDRRDVVLARQQRGVEIGRHRRREGRHIGAEIGDGLDPQRR